MTSLYGLLAKRRIVALHDALIAGLSFSAALVLRSGPQGLAADDAPWLAIALFAATAAVVFAALGLSTSRWRFTAFADLRRLALAAVLATLVGTLVIFVVTRLEGVPRSVPPICCQVLLPGLFLPRIVVRLLHERRAERRERARAAPDRVLVVGGAERIAAHLADGGFPAPVEVVGLVLPEVAADQGPIDEIPVCGAVADLATVLERLTAEGTPPDRIVTLGPYGDRIAARTVVAAAARHGVPLDRIADPSASDPARVMTLEDLLCRHPTDLSPKQVRDLCEGRRVLITGAGGSIGSKIAELVAGLGPRRLILLDHGEHALYLVDRALRETFPALDLAAAIADVRDAGRIRRLVAAERPEVVFHAAALKHVPLSEANPCEAVRTNAIGTAVVADACVAEDVDVLVLISTDKAVDPTSVMGAGKRAAEMYCQALDLAQPVTGHATRFVTVRFGNVLGSTGSVVPLFERQIARGGPVTVTHPDMRRYFMTVEEACGLVLHAAALGSSATEGELARGCIFELDMGEPLRILDLARAMIVLAGKRPDIDIRIETIGIRPGEKLFEEIFHSDEPLMPTAEPAVLVARPRPVDLARVRRAFVALEAAAADGNVAAVMRRLKDLMPEFQASVLQPRPEEEPPHSGSDAAEIVPLGRKAVRSAE